MRNRLLAMQPLLPPARPDPNVQSVTRAFSLLAEMNRQRLTTVRHLHAATGLPKATIVRLLQTLAAAGYVANDKRQGGYLVTSQVQSLSCGYHGDPLVVEAGRPWAAEFTRRHRWPIAIAVLDRDAVRVRFSTIPDSPISPFHATVNMRLCLLTRALGRAYLAFCPAAERDVLLATLRASSHPEDVGARHRASVLRMLDAAQRAGYAQRAANVEPRSSSTIGVPIRHGSGVLASVGMTYFKSAVSRRDVAERYVPMLQSLARNIEASVTHLAG
jgi:IclR family transcriptional regulator, mhp operon transcriptional activator